ncbi:MAG TPA: ImmA/IrrE family metallo-endopeptidase [Bacteroidia bacterium]|jgi:hypothetical protein|nr:ImmA/IrrE family metallo-endopeptidase [Bacteroidia bacterium]
MGKELPKDKFRRGFKAQAERHSIEYRERVGVKGYQFLSSFVLAEHLGIKVIAPDNLNGFSPDEFDILTNTRKEEWSAAAIQSFNGSLIIIHNKSHSSGRQESNIMHELAHVICGHQMSGIENRPDIPFTLRTYNQEQENEADWLGSCLQLPRPGLTWAYRRGMSEEEIAEHFCSSKDMVRFRTNMTGVKKQFSSR